MTHNRLHHLREFDLVTDTLSSENSSVVSLRSTRRSYLDAICEFAGFQSTLKNSLRPAGNSSHDMPFDLLPRLNPWDSPFPMGILQLRVSSAVQICFRVVSLTGRHPITTKGVLSNACSCSSVKRAFPPAHGRRPRSRSGRQGVHPAGPHGSDQLNCYAVHGSPPL